LSRADRVVNVRFHRRSIAVVALVGALALSQLPALAASAEDPWDPIQFNDPAPQTVEYGQGWVFDFAVDYAFVQFVYQQDKAVVSISGAPAGYKAGLNMYTVMGPEYLSYGSVYPAYEQPPLDVGSHLIKISGTDDSSDPPRAGATNPGVTVVVEKAKLGMDLRVLADPANGDAAIVTVKFTGRFVDEYQSSFFAGAAISPAGTWHITLTDDNGEVVVERNIERAAGDDVLATSFYWQGAEPGFVYTASADFIGSGSSANNFSVSSASDFSYTAPESQRAEPTSTATAQPNTELPQPAGFSLPLWALIVVGLLVAGLAALVTVLSVRLRRRPKPSTGEVSA
jgi:hypothetical protein